MDDAALVLAARSGDGDALAAIYDRYADRLHDYCWSILRDREEAADAFHDAFLAAAQRLDQLRDPSKLRPWLYAIARHEALRRTTARRPVEELDDMTADGAPEVDEPAPRRTPSASCGRRPPAWPLATGLSSTSTCARAWTGRTWPTPWASKWATPTSCSAACATRSSARSARCSSPATAGGTARSWPRSSKAGTAASRRHPQAGGPPRG